MQKVVLGVTGSIAVYKSLTLVRLLIKSGREVRVVMTPSATAFVSPLSFATLSKHDVHVDLIDKDTWSNHVELGLWADIMLIAPATAATLSKMASGHCDNMLIATYLSAKSPVVVAPAMDLDMWKHPSTKENLKRIVSYGNKIIPVGNGELASGLIGDGRMAEPADILRFLEAHQRQKEDLKGQHILITAGPTQESIDPVRFISNHSSGTMGFRLAEACEERGARVSLILGPTSIQIDNKSIKVHRVRSAADMLQECGDLYDSCDVAIFAAAVADYTPTINADQKVKKSDEDLSIPLKRTVDIAKSMGGRKKKHQINVGFALETQKGVEYAKGKLGKKNFDFIVLNSLKDKGAGFGTDTNKITIISKDSDPEVFPLKSKVAVANDIIDKVVTLLVADKQEI
ncbi:MAG: phosphopantothenoylcysteine decarboxylase/phosphopantothenate--cysteine ligase [Saprospiraceae bacterium]|jgi:phosphopantothenoylcysteine decarboxylase/phosphopantothenate--cysteine ligase